MGYLDRFTEWTMCDLPVWIGLPLFMFTVAVPIVSVIALIAWADSENMARHHCHQTGRSRTYWVSSYPVSTGHGMVMIPGHRATSHEYSCDDGFRWR